MKGLGTNMAVLAHDRNVSEWPSDESLVLRSLYRPCSQAGPSRKTLWMDWG
jgi:hypothetical protein